MVDWKWWQQELLVTSAEKQKKNFGVNEEEKCVGLQARVSSRFF